MQYDVIVIGVGGMGSATLYQLARRGVKVLGLERFDIPHDMGSSHGTNRIIRLAYWEHPTYVPLLRRAYELWREIEFRAGEKLLFVTGGLDIGTPESDNFKGSLLSCTVHHLPHTVMEADEVNRRFPGYRLTGDLLSVYQPDAGFVLSERSICAHVFAALDLGAEVHAREQVLGWAVQDGVVRVRTDRGEYTAARLVVTAGPWAAKLVPALGKRAVAERQVLIWTQPKEPQHYRLGAFPVFNMMDAAGGWYGFPVYGVPGFKIGKYHHLNQVTDPDRVDRAVHPEDEAVLRGAIRRYFPGADGPTMALKVCMFTNSPDLHFILDRHPAHPQVVLAAGFSGHGYKFCSVVGEIMADLALEGGSRFDLGFFSLSRFAASI